MSLAKPKNLIQRLGNLLNSCAIFALIVHVFNPLASKAASDSINLANISKTELVAVETSLSESLEAKVLNAKVAPDKTVPGVITAYTSTVDQTDDSPFIAASGKRVYDGMIAVNGLPFGTRIKIPELYGDKIFTVHDRMNRRYFCRPTRCRLDIWLDASKSEARQFGVKRVAVEIYYPVKELATR